MITVKRDWVEPTTGEQLSIIDSVPAFLEEFVAKPDTFTPGDRQRYPTILRDWVKDGQFVLNYNNDYWLDSDGEVESS